MTTLAPPVLGMTVMPEYIQVEGVQQILDRAGGVAGARALCTAPAVMEPADEATGAREPPADAGAGGVRTLDRPLWGHHALYLRSAPSFVPDAGRYAGSFYQPPPAQELTRREGGRISEFLAACRRAGIETQFQIMAAAPPAIRVQFRQSRVEDEPLTAFDQMVPGRVDANLSLAAPALRTYMRALITDIVAQYPDLDALRFDWPEYPPYAPDSLLFDFSAEAVGFGAARGIDVDALRHRWLDCLAKRTDFAALVRTFGPTGLSEASLADVGLTEVFDFRAALVCDYARFLVQTVAEASGGRVKVYLQGFPPPLNRLSGFDLAGLDSLGADLGVKLFTMHWPMIERAYAERLTALTGLDLTEALNLV
ncbi:MAG: hypothetical protein LCH61_17680, partial [Proteobacteria bacterium]|nr:hypothetical protein [Pseudomonadota bacterium]